MVSRALLKSERGDWKTPKTVIKCLEKLFGEFDLDPCGGNPDLGIPRVYTVKDNGLLRPWFGRVYVNPPYGRSVEAWVDKAVREVRLGRVERVVMLLASRTDTRWFHDLVLKYATAVLFVRGRIRFVGASNSALFPSLVVVF